VSNTDQSGVEPGQNQLGENLNLGESPWAPTQPANEFLGLTPESEKPAPAAGFGYGQSGAGQYGQATPSYGQPQQPPYQAPTPPPPYGQQASYTVYTPQPEAQAYPSQAYPPQAYPAQIYPPGLLVPGQIVSTPYGNFVVGAKSKLAAGLLGIFLGGLGVGRFYRGHAGIGVAQLAVTICTAGIGALWGLIEGILVLVAQPGTPQSLDSDGQIMA